MHHQQCGKTNFDEVWMDNHVYLLNVRDYSGNCGREWSSSWQCSVCRKWASAQSSSQAGVWWESHRRTSEDTDLELDFLYFSLVCMFLALTLPKFKGIFILSKRNFRWAFSVFLRRFKLDLTLLESVFKERCWADTKNTVVNPEKRTLQIKWKAGTGHVSSGFYSRFKIITTRLNPLALHSPREQSWSNRMFPP